MVSGVSLSPHQHCTLTTACVLLRGSAPAGPTRLTPATAVLCRWLASTASQRPLGTNTVSSWRLMRLHGRSGGSRHASRRSSLAVGDSLVLDGGAVAVSARPPESGHHLSPRCAALDHLVCHAVSACHSLLSLSLSLSPPLTTWPHVLAWSATFSSCQPYICAPRHSSTTSSACSCCTRRCSIVLTFSPPFAECSCANVRHRGARRASTDTRSHPLRGNVQSFQERLHRRKVRAPQIPVRSAQ